MSLCAPLVKVRQKGNVHKLLTMEKRMRLSGGVSVAHV